MLKNGTNHFKVNSEDEKISEIKRKSKSINKENIKKEKIITLNPLSNQALKNKKKKSNLFFHKRKSKIEIDANKHLIKNNNGEKIREDKKDNYLTENSKGLGIVAKNAKYKLNYNSFDNKKERLNEAKENKLVKNNYLFRRFENNKNIGKEETAKNETKEQQKEKELTKEQTIVENKMHSNNNNNIPIDVIKNNDEKEKMDNKPEKMNNNKSLEKNEVKINSNPHFDLNSKNETPLLKLNDVNSSSSSTSSIPNIKNKQSVTSEDVTESSYDDSHFHFEIKGELLSKTEKTNFLNNIKKCLFNREININSENDFIKDIKQNKQHKINLKQNLSSNELQLVENNLKINSGFITKAGLDEQKEKTNQDSYLILQNLFENILNFFGIFDGHGKNGHLISSLVSKFLSNYLSNKENYHIDNNNSDDSDSDSSISSKESIIDNQLLSSLFSNEDFIKKIISELDMKANECNFDLQFSGTTCLLLFILNNKLICSNIGDSICVLFNCSNEERWTHEIISKIHKPDIETEKERILGNGGVIYPYYDEFGVYEGPNRVYVKGKTYPGLSLTRSIGDLEGEKIGIISEPEIVVKKIDSTCKYIVLGSDGLWDVVKPYDVRRIVNPFFYRNDPKGACQALEKQASKNWEKNGYDRDDITIIVVFIGTTN